MCSLCSLSHGFGHEYPLILMEKEMRFLIGYDIFETGVQEDVAKEVGIQA